MSNSRYFMSKSLIQNKNNKLVSLKLVDCCEKTTVETNMVENKDENIRTKIVANLLKFIDLMDFLNSIIGKNFKKFLMAKQKVILKLLRLQEIKMHKEQSAMLAIKIR